MTEDNRQSNEDSLILVNIAEEFVKPKVREALEVNGACQCETCFLNACALALNDIPPRYVTTTKGSLISRALEEMDFYNKTATLVAVTKAVMKVKNRPHHSVNSLFTSNDIR